MNLSECSPSSRNCDPIMQAKLAGDQAANIPADQLQQPSNVSPSRQQSQQSQQPQQSQQLGFDPNEYMLAEESEDSEMGGGGEITMSSSSRKKKGPVNNEDFYIRIAIAFLFLTQLYIIFRMNN